MFLRLKVLLSQKRRSKTIKSAHPSGRHSSCHLWPLLLGAWWHLAARPSLLMLLLRDLHHLVLSFWTSDCCILVFGSVMSLHPYRVSKQRREHGIFLYCFDSTLMHFIHLITVTCSAISSHIYYSEKCIQCNWLFILVCMVEDWSKKTAVKRETSPGMIKKEILRVEVELMKWSVPANSYVGTFS